MTWKALMNRSLYAPSIPLYSGVLANASLWVPSLRVLLWSGLQQGWRVEGHLFILPFEEHASWRELNICMCIGSEIYDPSSLQEYQPWGCQNSIPCVYTQHTDLCLASEWESHRTKKCKHYQPRNPTGTEGYEGSAKRVGDKSSVPQTLAKTQPG